MKKLDPHTMFALFEQGDEQIYKEHGLEQELNNPFVLLGMVIRGVENWYLLDKLYMNKYREHYEGVRDSTKYKYFVKVYKYLERIDTDKFESKYAIGTDYDAGNTNVILDALLRYFEDLEQYERCAVIKKYIDLLYDRVADRQA